MITIELGEYTTFHGYCTESILGTPCGRQWASGSSRECEPSLRSSNSFFDQGWYGTSSGFISRAKSRIYRLSSGDHEPERSGLPSARRGAGAFRSISPDLVRGASSGGTLSHCPNVGGPGSNNATIATRSF